MQRFAHNYDAIVRGHGNTAAIRSYSYRGHILPWLYSRYNTSDLTRHQILLAAECIQPERSEMTATVCKPNVRGNGMTRNGISLICNRPEVWSFLYCQEYL